MATIMVSGDESSGLETLLNCPICMEPYTNPKVLPCQHTFCQACLQNMYDCYHRERMTIYGQLQCPTCRTKAVLPRNGIEGLPNDFKVNQIRDFVEKVQISTTESQDRCAVCRFEGRTTDAEFYCVQCTKHLCLDCAEQHAQNELFQSHSTISTESDRDDVSSPKCEEHKEEIKYFCSLCTDLLCTVCVLLKHSTHQVTDLSGVSKKHQEGISQQLTNLRKKLHKYQDKFHQLGVIRQLKEQLFLDTRDHIKQHCATLREQLDEQERTLLNDLEEEHRVSMEMLEQEAETTDICIGNISSLCDFATDMTDPSQSLQLMVMHKNLHARMEKMSDMECKDIEDTTKKVHKFIPKQGVEAGELKLVMLRQSKKARPASLALPTSSAIQDEPDGTSPTAHREYIHSLSMERAGSSWEVPTGQTLPRSGSIRKDAALQRQKMPDVAGTVDVNLIWKKPGLLGARDVAFLPNQHLVVTEYKNRSDRLKLFDKRGNLLKRAASGSKDHSMKPWGIVHDPTTSMLLITDQRNPTIKILDGDFIMAQSLGKVFTKPSGLAITNQGQYVVSDTAPNRQCVGIYDQEGQCVRHWGSQGSSNLEFNNPEFVTTDHRGRIIISDNLNHCIKIFDGDGNFLFNFNQLGSTNKKLNQPEGVCVDSRNNILVAHGSQVSVFTQDGNYMTTLELSHSHRRFFSFLSDNKFYGISCDDAGHLAITTDSSVSVYHVPLLKGLA